MTGIPKRTFWERVRSLIKQPFSEVFMLVSCFFCHLIATYQHSAVASLAKLTFFETNKRWVFVLGSYNHQKTAFY